MSARSATISDAQMKHGAEAESDQPSELIDPHDRSIGNVARGWIDADEHRIACEREWNAGNPELIGRSAVECIAIDQKLIFCVKCGAMLDRRASQRLLYRVEFVFEHDVQQASLGREYQIALLHVKWSFAQIAATKAQQLALLYRPATPQCNMIRRPLGDQRLSERYADHLRNKSIFLSDFGRLCHFIGGRRPPIVRLWPPTTPHQLSRMVNITTLKISHGAFDGMCSEFHGWRCAVARAAGYRTEETWEGETIVLDWDTVTDGNIVGAWPTPPADPLLVLLAHSDVAGKISPADGLLLADRLNELPIPTQWRG
jgi:hypothetical protein